MSKPGRGNKAICKSMKITQTKTIYIFMTDNNELDIV